MQQMLWLVVRRCLLTGALVGLFLLIPLPRWIPDPLGIPLPSVKSAVGVFFVVILLGKTLYDTLFSRP